VQLYPSIYEEQSAVTSNCLHGFARRIYTMSVKKLHHFILQ